MCGVFATNRPDLWASEVETILDLLRHRGPDATGSWLDGRGDVLLAHTRLSIIGLDSSGSQPVLSADNQLALTYNGEIYNYRKLAVAMGQPEIRSDTRLLANLVRAEGRSATARLRGMYAFVAWDQERRVLLAARDPWGIKPLYLLRHPTGGVTLASELPVLLRSGDAREIDRVGLAHYLAFGHTNSDTTMFKRISKVPPGAFIEWQQTAHGWIQHSFRIERPNRNHSEATVAEAVDDSVAAHLVADVEVGLFLSGGVDSTLLATVASERVPSLRTFTLSFPDYGDLDESNLAEANARALGVSFQRIPVTAPDMAAAASVFLGYHGEPFGDAAALPLTCLASAACSDLKVVLTGEGADELFHGYARYGISRMLDSLPLSLVRKPPMFLVRRLGALTAARWSRRRTDRPRDRAIEALLWGGGVRSHTALLDGESGWMIRLGLPWAADALNLAGADWLVMSDSSAELDHACAYDEDRWLSNLYLEKTDRATMASSIEARVPYLDQAVASAARRAGVTDKSLLREDLRRRLPSVQLATRKRGLAVPIDDVIASGLQSSLDFELASGTAILDRVLGSNWRNGIVARAKTSRTLRYRIAILGLWEELFKGDSFA